ncbi:hypothetical protein HHL16_17910 [Pseudoflavitalea sp. G-6-1-2]|uniref:hypothetical protein n=1 Tax=Pseudoflavitalea sp. G-6-1-2 TaxID=2728841 RepID=UPI00146A7536|nr:hypothetical protein [Pseudoflavitalea sp. G-6-1-2]NML22765.1 hypothetical protein [Pseudoflavitalea sp. G-6-1-2]
MKTSSKIFTGIFMTPIIIPLIVAGTIIYKVKSGQVEKDGFDGRTYDAQYFPQAKHIVVNGFYNLEIEISDSTEVDIYHSHAVMARTKMKGDTLMLNGDTTMVSRRTGKDIVTVADTTTEGTSRKVVLKIPSGFPVTLLHTTMELSLKQADKAPNFNLELINSTLRRDSYHDENVRAVGQLNITGKESVLEIRGLNIQSLQLDLSHSKADLSSSEINAFNLKIDSTSGINLKGEHLKKLSPTK